MVTAAIIIPATLIVLAIAGAASDLIDIFVW